MVHGIAYGRTDGNGVRSVLTKCAQKVDTRDAVAFHYTCPECLAPGSWPSEKQQLAAGFTAKGGKSALDKLAGARS